MFGFPKPFLGVSEDVVGAEGQGDEGCGTMHYVDDLSDINSLYLTDISSTIPEYKKDLNKKSTVEPITVEDETPLSVLNKWQHHKDQQRPEMRKFLIKCTTLQQSVAKYKMAREIGVKGPFPSDIGGDIQQLFQKAVAKGLVPASALSSTEDEAEVIDGAVVRNSEFFTLSRPDSVSVSKSSENRKVKSAIGSRSKSSLPVPLKKKVLASPEENQTIFSPLSGKDLLSPGNSTVSLQKSTPSRPSSTKTRQRPQTARLSRPDDEKFSVKEKNFLSPECSGFLRPTASSKAKAFGTPTTPKPSPSKSVGNSRRNSHMMGDAGADGSSPTTSVGASGEPGVEPVLSASLKEQFGIFSRFGDASSDGKQISLSNADKWMKQAHVIDGKKITTTDTSITFKKLFKTSKKVGFEDFKRYVEDLSKSKSMEGKEILDKLTNCGTPGLSQATKAAHAGVVSRLTDTSKYTGSSKERFDSAGKGRGMVGRKDVKDTSGYVAAFKEKQDGQSTSPTPK